MTNSLMERPATFFYANDVNALASEVAAAIKKAVF